MDTEYEVCISTWVAGPMISGFIHLPRMLKNAPNYFGPPRAIILSPSGMNKGRATPHPYGQRRGLQGVAFYWVS